MGRIFLLIIIVLTIILGIRLAYFTGRAFVYYDLSDCIYETRGQDSKIEFLKCVSELRHKNE